MPENNPGVELGDHYLANTPADSNKPVSRWVFNSSGAGGWGLLSSVVGKD